MWNCTQSVHSHSVIGSLLNCTELFVLQWFHQNPLTNVALQGSGFMMPWRLLIPILVSNYVYCQIEQNITNKPIKKRKKKKKKQKTFTAIKLMLIFYGYHRETGGREMGRWAKVCSNIRTSGEAQVHCSLEHKTTTRIFWLNKQTNNNKKHPPQKKTQKRHGSNSLRNKTQRRTGGFSVRVAKVATNDLKLHDKRNQN